MCLYAFNIPKVNDHSIFWFYRQHLKITCKPFKSIVISEFKSKSTKQDMFLKIF